MVRKPTEVHRPYRRAVKRRAKQMFTSILCICEAKNGSEFKVSSLRAIRAAIDRYLKQPPHNKSWSIGDSEFAKANQTLNACLQKHDERRESLSYCTQKPDNQRTNAEVVYERSAWRSQHKTPHNYCERLGST